MCDVSKYNKITNELLNLDISDYRQLIVEAESEEMRKFYVNIYNYFLQKRQKQIIQEHIF